MSSNRSIERIIDQQVKRWQILANNSSKKVKRTFGPTITVSREVGSGGLEIARQLAKQLDFCLFDKEIIEQVAKSARLNTAIAESLDEKGRVALEDWLLVTISSHKLMPDQYLEHLLKVVGTIGQHGYAVILGRGAGFILPQEKCFRVRCVAPYPSRIKRWSEELGISPAECEKKLLIADQERRTFITNSFNVAENDPANYDLVINTDTIGIQTATDIVQRAMKDRQLIT